MAGPFVCTVLRPHVLRPPILFFLPFMIWTTSTLQYLKNHHRQSYHHYC